MVPADARLRSEIGCFHKGISLTLCVLAGLDHHGRNSPSVMLWLIGCSSAPSCWSSLPRDRPVSALASLMEGVKDAHPDVDESTAGC